MDQSEIIALISLLEDPDQEIRDQIRARICEEGRAITPYLEEHREMHDVVGWPVLIQNIIEEIRSKELTKELDAWFKGGCEDLIEGALLVARFDDDELDEAQVRSFMARLRQDIWLELNENLTAFEKVKVMNIFFFEEYGFRGNKEDYHRPDNSFIHKVIENRSGNPLLLSILYTSIAQSLDIPIKGINLPNHFIVAYMLEDDWLLKAIAAESDIMFYINPFSKGAILHKAEIDQFLAQLDLKPEPRFFEPCGNGAMIRRMINNLMHAYQKQGDEEKVSMLSEFVQLISASRS